MFSKIIGVGLLIAVYSASSAQALQFGRTYKVGDKDVYVVSVVRSGKMTMTVGFNETLEVTNAPDDGTAEVSVKLSDLKISRDGKDIPVPASAASALGGSDSVEFLSKQGFPYQVKGNGLTSALPVFGQSIFAKGLTVGQDVTFDNDGKSDGGHTKGTITLTDLTGTIGHIHVVSESISAKGDTTSHVDGVYTYDSSSGKLTKIDFKVHSEAKGGSDAEITMTLQ